MRILSKFPAALRAVVAVGLALALTACAGSVRPKFSETYTTSEAQHLFQDAFAHIQNRYIEPVAIAPLALNGMNAFLQPTTDGAVWVQGDHATVALYDGSDALVAFRRPGARDGRGWAAVMAEILQRATTAEPGLNAMSSEDIYRGVMDGVVKGLDPFSRYASARAADQQRAAREGFGGIGVSIRTEAGLTHVVQILVDTPAERSGLRVGDLITHVDGEPIGGLTAGAVVERMRGRAGSMVALDVQRAVPLRSQRISLRRAFIVPMTVQGWIEADIAVLRISSFNRNTADDLENVYDDLARDAALRGIVLDLRGNPGGLLDQAVLAADLFLGDGLVISTVGRHPAANSVFTADARQIGANLPMAILINGESASAAELLAAALQDRGRAVVIGTATHGKGSVQNLASLPNGGELILTWSRMHAPSGYMLDGLGVLPSICTSAAPPLASEAAVDASLIAFARRAASWHRYNRADPGLAAALRLGCPAGAEERDSDMALAIRLLRNQALYRRSLLPALESAAARLDALPGAS